VVVISKSRVFHGGPTSGKTSFVKILLSVGIDVIDTDDLIEELCPEFFNARLWRLRPENIRIDANLKEGKDGASITPARILEGIGEARDAAVFFALGRALADNPKAVAFTNLWLNRPHHIKLLPKDALINGKIPISFFVTDPNELVKRSIKRGDKSGGIPLTLAQKWVKSWESYAPKAFFKRIPLSSGQYVGNISDFSNHPIIGPQWGKIKLLMEKEYGDTGSTSKPGTYDDRPKCSFLLEHGFIGAVCIDDRWHPVKPLKGETPFKACTAAYKELAPNSEPHNSVWKSIHVACGTANPE